MSDTSHLEPRLPLRKQRIKLKSIPDSVTQERRSETAKVQQPEVGLMSDSAARDKGKKSKKAVLLVASLILCLSAGGYLASQRGSENVEPVDRVATSELRKLVVSQLDGTNDRSLVRLLAGENILSESRYIAGEDLVFELSAEDLATVTSMDVFDEAFDVSTYRSKDFTEADFSLGLDGERTLEQVSMMQSYWQLRIAGVEDLEVVALKDKLGGVIPVTKKDGILVVALQDTPSKLDWPLSLSCRNKFGRISKLEFINESSFSKDQVSWATANPLKPFFEPVDLTYICNFKVKMEGQSDEEAIDFQASEVSELIKFGVGKVSQFTDSHQVIFKEGEKSEVTLQVEGFEPCARVVAGNGDVIFSLRPKLVRMIASNHSAGWGGEVELLSNRPKASKSVTRTIQKLFWPETTRSIKCSIKDNTVIDIPQLDYSHGAKVRVVEGVLHGFEIPLIEEGESLQLNFPDYPTKLVGEHVAAFLPIVYSGEVADGAAVPTEYVKLALVSLRPGAGMKVGLIDSKEKLIVAEDYACQWLSCSKEGVWTVRMCYAKKSVDLDEKQRSGAVDETLKIWIDEGKLMVTWVEQKALVDKSVNKDSYRCLSWQDGVLFRRVSNIDSLFNAKGGATPLFGDNSMTDYFGYYKWQLSEEQREVLFFN